LLPSTVGCEVQMAIYNSSEVKRLRDSVSMSKCLSKGISALAVNSLAVALVLFFAVPSGYSQTKAEKKELAALNQMASDGDVKAQLELGTRYLLGRGVPVEDAVQARDWFVKAADKGNADAQFWLGEMYSTGWGIPQDRARAAIWYRKAANQGLASAQFAIGNMYETGRGAPLNHKEAMMWIQKAAKQDFAPAKTWIEAHPQDSPGPKAETADEHRLSQDQTDLAASPAERSPAQIDIRYFPGNSQPVTDVQMREIRDSLRWEPELVVLKQGGTGRSNLIDGKGQKMGSVLVRWDKTTPPGADKNSSHPDEWHGQFSIQIENGTSCRFTSSAELVDDQGFIVVTKASWNSWLTQHQPEAGQTSQTRGDTTWTQNLSSLALRPLTPYSTLSACTTPQN
jgi:TPR repeat protein